MNKKLKSLLLSLLLVALCFNTMPVGATDLDHKEDLDLPLDYQVTLTTTVDISISGNRAHGYYSYHALQSTFVRSEIYSYFQKYVNGSWVAADTNQTYLWTDNSTDYIDSAHHYMWFYTSGSYRFKVVMYIYGTMAKSDRIEGIDYEDHFAV